MFVIRFHYVKQKTKNMKNTMGHWICQHFIQEMHFYSTCRYTKIQEVS